MATDKMNLVKGAMYEFKGKPAGSGNAEIPLRRAVYNGTVKDPQGRDRHSFTLIQFYHGGEWVRASSASIKMKLKRKKVQLNFGMLTRTLLDEWVDGQPHDACGTIGGVCTDKKLREAVVRTTELAKEKGPDQPLRDRDEIDMIVFFAKRGKTAEEIRTFMQPKAGS